MSEERHDIVRVDATGTAHPVGKTASQRMRARQGAFRVMPAPPHIIVMRYVGEDGRLDDEDGPVFRLSGEIVSAGGMCDIVALIGQAGWKGELVVLDGTAHRSLFFEQGCVIAAQSSVEGERLGEVLYRYGALTEEQVSQASAAVTPDQRFGDAAVKLGLLTRERLFQLMNKQTEEIFYAVVRVGSGMFYFLDSYDERRLASRQKLAVSALLMDAVRRMDETRYFRERIPSDQHVPGRVAGRGPPPDELRKVYDAIDGLRSVQEIGREVGQGEFEVTQTLFQLVQSGYVIVHAPRPTGPAAIVALFNEAIVMVLREVDTVGRGAEVRRQLASFATGAGIYDALFQRAGPAPDGTLDADRLIENAGILVGHDQAETMLAQWLHEYISFAIFIADSVLREDPGAPRRADGGTQAPAVTKSVADIIAPLMPTH
jgi:hypothetical protein